MLALLRQTSAVGFVSATLVTYCIIACIKATLSRFLLQSLGPVVGCSLFKLFKIATLGWQELSPRGKYLFVSGLCRGPQTSLSI